MLKTARSTFIATATRSVPTSRPLLPELVISTAQVAPAPKKGDKGSDVTVRLTNIKLTVIPDPPNDDGTIFFCDMTLSATQFYQGNERALEPRLERLAEQLLVEADRARDGRGARLFAVEVDLRDEVLALVLRLRVLEVEDRPGAEQRVSGQA